MGTLTGTTVAELIATTREAWATQDVVDNVFQQHPSTELFKSAATSASGNAVHLNIVGGTKSGTWTTSSGAYTSAVDGDLVGRAIFEWSKPLVVPTRIAYADLEKNSGPEALVDLAKVHLEAAVTGTANAVATALHAATSTDAGLESFQTLIKASGTVGAINPATATYWVSTVNTVDSDLVGIRKAFQQTLNLVTLAGGERPTDVLAGVTVYEAAQDAAAALGQVQLSGSNGAVDLGFDEVRISGLNVRLDPDLADDEAFLIHKPSLVARYLTDNMVKVMEARPVPNSLDFDIVTTSILTFGVTNRRSHAKLIWTPTP